MRNKIIFASWIDGKDPEGDRIPIPPATTTTYMQFLKNGPRKGNRKRLGNRKKIYYVTLIHHHDHLTLLISSFPPPPPPQKRRQRPDKKNKKVEGWLQCQPASRSILLQPLLSSKITPSFPKTEISAGAILPTLPNKPYWVTWGIREMHFISPSISTWEAANISEMGIGPVVLTGSIHSQYIKLLSS